VSDYSENTNCHFHPSDGEAPGFMKVYSENTNCHFHPSDGEAKLHDRLKRNEKCRENSVPGGIICKSQEILC